MGGAKRKKKLKKKQTYKKKKSKAHMSPDTAQLTTLNKLSQIDGRNANPMSLDDDVGGQVTINDHSKDVCFHSSSCARHIIISKTNTGHSQCLRCDVASTTCGL